MKKIYSVVPAMAVIAVMLSVLTGCKNPLYGPVITNTPTPNMTETAVAALWTKTITPTHSATLTHTDTGTMTETYTASPTYTLTRTRTATRVITVTSTRTFTRTRTATRVITATATRTCTVTPTPSWVAVMIYSSNVTGDFEIFSVEEGGANPVNLTNNIAADTSPKWSPDGSKIAFISDRQGNSFVYTMGADGQNVSNVSVQHPWHNYDMISWSADSAKIVFCDSALNSVCTSRLGQINGFSGGHGPVWSPAGSKIAYFMNTGAYDDVFVMDDYGANKVRLTTAGGSFPAWSPDGAKIAFIRGSELYTMNADGAGQVALTSGANVDGIEAPSWSPDGSKLLFLSAAGGGEVCVIDSTGANMQNLTNNAGRDKNPAWSRNGSRIAFASNRDGDFDIYVMNADGTDLLQWTNNTADDSAPSWK